VTRAAGLAAHGLGDNIRKLVRTEHRGHLGAELLGPGKVGRLGQLYAGEVHPIEQAGGRWSRGLPCGAARRVAIPARAPGSDLGAEAARLRVGRLDAFDSLTVRERRAAHGLVLVPHEPQGVGLGHVVGTKRRGILEEVVVAAGRAVPVGLRLVNRRLPLEAVRHHRTPPQNSARAVFGTRIKRPQRTARSSPRRIMERSVFGSTCRAAAACAVVNTSGRSAKGTYP
jgi:hypothetical protein